MPVASVGRLQGRNVQINAYVTSGPEQGQFADTKLNMKQTNLNATVLASPYDQHYEMALIYCVDKQSGHCFSLTRFPDKDVIEVMVVDQIVEKVLDLEVVLKGYHLQARLPPELTRRLDGVEQYAVHLDLPDQELPNLIKSLEKIFEGKSGLRVLQA